MYLCNDYTTITNYIDCNINQYMFMQWINYCISNRWNTLYWRSWLYIPNSTNRIATSITNIQWIMSRMLYNFGNRLQWMYFNDCEMCNCNRNINRFSSECNEPIMFWWNRHYLYYFKCGSAKSMFEICISDSKLSTNSCINTNNKSMLYRLSSRNLLYQNKRYVHRM